MEEILHQRNFSRVGDLLHLLRLISPETHAKHPNGFRRNLVQVGRYFCPEPDRLPSLIQELFHSLPTIQDNILRAIYVHHELVRIHPFLDGNGRVARMAKNWILMFDLGPPIFITADEGGDYRKTLAESFQVLEQEPRSFPLATKHFFETELARLQRSCDFVYQSVSSAVSNRKAFE